MVRTNYMGRVTFEAKVENATDSARTRRVVPISEAVIDPSVSTFALPASILRDLGFTAPTATWRPLYGPVRLTVFGRDITLDAVAADDDLVRIGQIPLEHLQLVVDRTNHRLEKSSANGGEWVLDAY